MRSSSDRSNVLIHSSSSELESDKDINSEAVVYPHAPQKICEDFLNEIKVLEEKFKQDILREVLGTYKRNIVGHNKELCSANFVDEQNNQIVIKEMIETIGGEKALLQKTIEYNYNGKKWIKDINFKYNITTWTYEPGDEIKEQERKLGRVGTDRKTVIKLFNEESYDFVRTEDFVERGHLVYEGALLVLKTYTAQSNVQNDNSLLENPENNVETNIKPEDLEALDSLKRGYQYLVERYHQLHAEEMKLGDAAFARFQKERDQVATLIADLAISFAKEIKRITKTDKSLTDIIADIEQAEKLYVIEKGRPNIIKLEMPKKNQPGILSAQFALGERTIPSSHRYRKLRDVELGTNRSLEIAEQLANAAAPHDLSNFVEDYTAKLSLEENSSEIKIESMINVLGHSSLPPIAVKDELTRRYLAIEAAKTNLAAIVKSKLQDNEEQSSLEHPIEISLSTMLLMTPSLGKRIENIGRGFESETAQVSETAMVLEILQNQAEPIEITIGNKKHYVKLNANFMNVPVNVGRSGQNFLETHMQRKINARGFVEYCELMQEGLDRKYNNDDVTHSAIQDIRHQFDDLKINYNNEMIINLKKQLEDDQQSLALAHQACQLYLNEYVKENTTDAEKKSITANYRRKRAEINVIEKNRHNIYLQIIAAQKAIFVSKTAEINKLQKEISKRLGSNQHHFVGLTAKDRDYLQLLQRYLKAQYMYYNEFYKDYLYHFQALYLLSSAQVGRTIETNCKSAEDRTGWMRIVLLAYAMFNNEKNRDPLLHSEADVNLFNELLSKARDLSASLENNDYNAPGARGPQVSNEKIAKSMATLAKAPLGVAKQAAGQWPVWKKVAVASAVVLTLTVITALAIAVIYSTGGIGAGALFGGLYVAANTVTFGLPSILGLGAATLGGTLASLAILGSLATAAVAAVTGVVGALQKRFVTKFKKFDPEAKNSAKLAKMYKGRVTESDEDSYDETSQDTLDPKQIIEPFINPDDKKKSQESEENSTIYSEDEKRIGSKSGTKEESTVESELDDAGSSKSKPLLPKNTSNKSSEEIDRGSESEIEIKVETQEIPTLPRARSVSQSESPSSEEVREMRQEMRNKTKKNFALSQMGMFNHSSPANVSVKEESVEPVNVSRLSSSTSS